jgi:hypothetical protein
MKNLFGEINTELKPFLVILGIVWKFLFFNKFPIQTLYFLKRPK